MKRSFVGTMAPVSKSSEQGAVVKLNWQGSEPGLDPFAALSGVGGQFLVSTATCAAWTDDEIRSVLEQLVDRSVLLARRLVSGAQRLLFLWDPVYAELKIVFADETLYRDGPIVTRCKFPLLDEKLSKLSREDERRWDEETRRLSQYIREALATQLREAGLPEGMKAMFSDRDRGSYSPEEFRATPLTS